VVRNDSELTCAVAPKDQVVNLT